jgi:hypothetical protein
VLGMVVLRFRVFLTTFLVSEHYPEKRAHT